MLQDSLIAKRTLFYEGKIELEHILMNIGISIRYNLIFLFSFPGAPILHTYPAIGHLEHYRRLSTGGGGGYKSVAAFSGVSGIAEAGGLGPAGEFALTDRNIPPINLKREVDWKGEVADQSALMHLLDSGCSCRASLGPSSRGLAHFFLLLFFFSFFPSFFPSLLLIFLLYHTLYLLRPILAFFHQIYSLFHQIYSHYCILICLDYSA